MNVHIYYPDVSSSRTPASSSKPAIIIRRHAPAKPHPRARLPEDIAESAGPSTSPHAQSQEDNRSVSELPEESTDELARIRHLLRPPPIPGVQDWGIPPEPTEPCDEGIKVCCLALPPCNCFRPVPLSHRASDNATCLFLPQTKIATFLTLKRDLQNPRHFNDSLMANRAFRNPHLYAKLVEFVDVDERTTNFPKELWDPLDVKDEWYADRIGTSLPMNLELFDSTAHISSYTRSAAALSLGAVTVPALLCLVGPANSLRCDSHMPTTAYIAEAQKAKSEATSTAQQPSKRARIDFTSSSSSTSAQRADGKAGQGHPGGRHQPYSVPGRGGRSEGVLGGGYGKGRERTRWG